MSTKLFKQNFAVIRVSANSENLFLPSFALSSPLWPCNLPRKFAAHLPCNVKGFPNRTAKWPKDFDAPTDFVTGLSFCQRAVSLEAPELLSRISKHNVLNHYHKISLPVVFPKTNLFFFSIKKHLMCSYAVCDGSTFVKYLIPGKSHQLWNPDVNCACVRAGAAIWHFFINHGSVLGRSCWCRKSCINTLIS